MWPIIHGTVEAIGWIAIACVLITVGCLMFGKPALSEPEVPEPIIHQKPQRERFADAGEEEWRHG